MNAEFRTQMSERIYHHAVNYEVTQALEDVPISLHLPGEAEVKSVRFLDAEAGRQEEVAFVVTEGRVEFSLPWLNIYGVARIELD